MQLTENFSREEFSCKCGCGYDDIDMDLVYALQELRDAIRLPIHVCSGCRCEKHNKAVGGVKNSQHLFGKAADISCRWVSPIQMKKYALLIPKFASGGIGLYPGFLHVDVRDYVARW